MIRIFKQITVVLIVLLLLAIVIWYFFCSAYLPSNSRLTILAIGGLAVVNLVVLLLTLNRNSAPKRKQP